MERCLGETLCISSLSCKWKYQSEMQRNSLWQNPFPEGSSFDDQRPGTWMLCSEMSEETAQASPEQTDDEHSVLRVRIKQDLLLHQNNSLFITSGDFTHTYTHSHTRFTDAQISNPHLLEQMGQAPWNSSIKKRILWLLQLILKPNSFSTKAPHLGFP